MRRLEESQLVLCDISCVNPNVFFELGIRTAIDKPVALTRDNYTSEIPFDTSIVHFYTYDASLAPWVLESEIDKLSEHIKASNERSSGRNPLWRYFGLTTRGAFKPEESPIETKLDLVLQQLRDVTERAQVTYREPPVVPTAESPAPREETTVMMQRLEGKVLPELQAIASSIGVAGWYRLRKADLIRAIVARTQTN